MMNDCLITSLKLIMYLLSSQICIRANILTKISWIFSSYMINWKTFTPWIKITFPLNFGYNFLNVFDFVPF